LIEVLKEAGSTNAELVARLNGGERVPEGHWIVADRQTAGRGRLGREWLDGAGNFMGSTVVHLAPGDPAAPTLALVAGLALAETVSEFLPAGVHAMLKWPNDLLVNAAKLCGVLLERVGDAVVVGIGVNLACAPKLPERPTAALADFGPAPGRDAFADAVASRFSAELDRWRAHGLAPMLARWQAVAHPVGTPLTVQRTGDELLEGTFAGLSADGALQLRLGDGTTQTINSGEVNFVRS